MLSDGADVTLAALSSLMSPLVAQVGDLARPETPWPAATTCLAVDEWFRSQPDRSSLLVRDEAGAIGLVSRGTLLLALAGRYGFGRALLGDAPVARVAQWSPAILPAEAPVHEAAAAVLGRDAQCRYDDLLVRWPEGRWGVLSAAGVLEALAGILAAQATTDSLTGLANRERLLAELATPAAIPRQGARPALIFIDLDRFKQVNDVYGHNVGDIVLIEIAERLRRVARPGDVIARLGGDEFVIKLALTPDEGIDPVRNAHAVAQRLLATIIEPIHVGGVTLFVGASVGVAVAGTTGSDPDTLLREADLAMYTAKQAGGDRIELVSSVGRQLAPPLLGLAIDDTLRRALTDKQFRLHYQPIRRLDDNEVVSVEALVRWQDPRHGLRGPDEFLPAAEASGLIVAIDRWVLEEACRQLLEWDADPALSSPPSLNVNLSHPHLSHPELVEHVLGVLHATGLEPRRLRLEIPETASLSDLERAAPALKALRTAGVQLTLDDLGSGSSTLRHLSSLPVDGIKIDRSFIRNLLHNDNDHAVVKLLIDLAHNIGVKVTAEGVETAEQLQALVTLGCSAGQGYYLGRPVPVTPSAHPDWLTARHIARP